MPNCSEMRLSISKSTFSALLLGIVISVQAQEVDTTQVRNKFIPTGLFLGADVITLVKSNVNKQFTGWEVNTDFDIHRYNLTMDYGRWAMIQPLKTNGADNGQYNNDGKYFRFGVDINFLKRDPDRNRFFLGFRYGRASFSDSVSYTASYANPTTGSPTNYGDISRSLVNTNLVGRWAELTLGMRVKIYKFFWMGYTARMKFSPSVSGEKELISYDIPGYGLSSRRLYWGFNYQLFFRIPFTSKVTPLDTSKKD